jgi:hypothetical protein
MSDVSSFLLELFNNVLDELQTEMTAIDWPMGQDFYSVRIFLVIRDKEEGTDH